MAEETNSYFSQFEKSTAPIETTEIKETETEKPVDVITSSNTVKDEDYFSQFENPETIEFADTQETKPIFLNSKILRLKNLQFLQLIMVNQLYKKK